MNPYRPLLSLLVLSATIASAAESEVPIGDLFVAGEGGYHTYRIPAVVVTNKGTLLAFCEGRKTGRGDHGDLDMVLRRSTDGGKSWLPMQLVYEEGGAKKVTIGNPCPVVDRTTGIIWLPFCRNNNDVLMTSSSDDGLTWAKPVEITGDVKQKDWGWVATGPGNAIQLTRGKHKGRLVIPCDHRVRGKAGGSWTHAGRSHAFYSDDHGRTWQLGKPTLWAMNECAVAQRVDGSLILNMRSYRGKSRRCVSTSSDGGATWTEPVEDPVLVESVCQASLIRYTWPSGTTKGRLLFSNPATPKGRHHLTVRISYDDGKTWPVSRLLYEGSSAYSNLVVLPDNTLGCLFERDGYKKISFARFDLDWLSRGKDKLATP